MSVSFRLPEKLFWLVLLFVFLTILAMAHFNAITFPFPNEDDASFFLPAWNLAVHGNLAPQVLNAPNGIYWVPHGYYVWLAPFLRYFGSTMETARWVSQITTAAAAVVLSLAMAQISRSRAFASLCAVLLVSPSVIYAANTLRMESTIFLLYSLAVLLHANRRYVLATTVLAGSLLIHPALVLSLILYVPAVAWLKYNRESDRHTAASSPLPIWVGPAMVALVVASMAAEGLLILRHADLFREHMALQAYRKTTGRDLWTILRNRRGILLCGESVLALVGFCLLRWHGTPREVLRSIGPVLLLAVGLQAYAAFGFEQSYLVYSYAIVPATLFACAYGAIGAGSSAAAGSEPLAVWRSDINRAH
jgi:hypothetical protein